MIVSQELECEDEIKSNNSDETVNFDQTQDFKESTKLKRVILSWIVQIR